MGYVSLLDQGDELTAGEDWTFDLTLKESLSGDPVDVTGATVTSSIWTRKPTDPEEVIAEHAVTLVTPASGEVRLLVTNAESAPLAAGGYQGDVKVVYSDSKVEYFGPYRFDVRRPLTG